MIWYLLALGVGTLFLVSLMDTGSQVELSYMDLVKLIEQGAPAEQPQGGDRGPRDRRRQGRERSATPTSTI